MGFLTNLERRAGVKMADEFIPETAVFDGRLPRTAYPYRRDIRNGLESNVVMAPVLWILRNFTQAEPVVERLTGRLWEKVAGHDLSQSMRRPNPFYGGGLLWKATVTSLCLDGNGYWQKVRNSIGEVIGFWYLPHFMVEPRWPQDGSTFISHYEYRPGGLGLKPLDLAVRDVVHFRYEGLDPQNPRKGLSPLKTLLREVFTDEEASNFSASILRNMGVPGGLIAPKDRESKISDPARLKDYMRSHFTGDRRGDWMVFDIPMMVETFGLDPNSLMLGNLRDISEERVCAVLGIPAAVVGFGAGLQQTKVGATMRENRQSAWHNCIIPMQNDIAEQASFQLVGDFHAAEDRFRVKFDRSMVSAFQEEETERAKRITLFVKEGMLRVDRAQELAGLEVDDSQAIYLRPAGAVPVPADGEADGSDARELDEERLIEAIAERVGSNGRNAGRNT